MRPFFAASELPSRQASNASTSRGDSHLVIDQVMKNASCHEDKMEAYRNTVRDLEDKFYDIEINHVPRRYNEEVDKLAKIVSG
jgi:hypothetical protein